MLPTTSGPCRFGKYSELVRHFMEPRAWKRSRSSGPPRRPITSISRCPAARRADKIKMQQVLFKGIHAADLLEDAFRRFRPYAVDKGAMDALKQARLEPLGQVVGRGRQDEDLVRWGRETVALFKAAKVRYEERFPLVLYIGEIYMRQHDPYTDLVDRNWRTRLESSATRSPTGCLRQPDEPAQCQRDTSLGLEEGNSGRALGTGRPSSPIIKGRYMASVAEKIAEPFHAVLAGRHVLPHPMEIIETLERNHEMHGSIEGESPLSTGIAYYLMHD